MLSPSQGCTSCLEYWTVASCLQSIVIAIYVLTVQDEGSTATQGKLFPKQEPECKRLSGNLRALLRPETRAFTVTFTEFFYLSTSQCQT